MVVQIDFKIRQVECIGCGTTFDYDVTQPRKKRCKPKCGYKQDVVISHRARTEKRDSHDLEFIAVDGEGITVMEPVPTYDFETDQEVVMDIATHKYVLLSVGKESFHKDGEELTFDEIFNFLWREFEKHPNAVFVGFVLGYDFTQWLKGIDAKAAIKLFTRQGIESRKRKNSDNPHPFPVRYGNWEFDLLGNKRLKLRPRLPKGVNPPTRIITHKDGTQTEERIPRPWMYINDAGPYFQGSFLSVIDPKKWPEPILTEEEYEIIKQGKERRSDAVFDKAMVKYNLMENEVLARIMKQMNESFVADGIKLRRDQFYGPGQAAQKWMSLIGLPTGTEIQEVVPSWALKAAQYSYYGGWFEVMNHGPVSGLTYSYDINSAYPYAISKMPCLLHGKWTRGVGKPPRLKKNAIRLIHATVHGKDNSIGCMPYRLPKSGSIIRPLHCAGWYWWHEFQASRRAKLIYKYDIDEWIDYEPCDCAPPGLPIVELYEGRLKVNKNSPRGKAKKLIYNSAYGKFAQSIGKPRFANPVYASFITSYCRMMILDAIATHPGKSDAVVMVATDSVTFFEPHPTIDIDNERLGAWDETVHSNLSILMPGVYWDDNTRERVKKGGVPKLKSRGISATDLSRYIDEFDRMWITPPRGCEFPYLEIPLRFSMVSAKLAISRTKWNTAGKVSDNEVRKLSGDPSGKRLPVLMKHERGMRSLVYSGYPVNNIPLESAAYDKVFGMTADDIFDKNDVSIVVEYPEGTAYDILAEGISGK